MIVTKDKAGQTIYITYVPDCDYNANGFYCETYSDKNCVHKIDDFCVHPGDCDFTADGFERYIKNYYKDEVLDLKYSF